MASASASASAAGWSSQAAALSKPSNVNVLEDASERAAALLAAEVPLPGGIPTVVLDVAAGPGTLALHVARRLAAAAAEAASPHQPPPPPPRVLVTDFAPGMVDAARAKFEAAGIVAQCSVADAHALGGVAATGSVSHAGCMFSVNLFERRDVALRELRRVLAPGGRAVVGTWREAGAADVAEAFARHVGALKPGEPVPASVQAVLNACRQPEDLTAELLAAGFSSCTVEALELTMVMQDPAVLLRMLRTNPAMAPMLAGAPEGVDFDKEWAAFLAPGTAAHAAFVGADGVALSMRYVANLAVALA
jgi:SAM-dependent methyltransferase